LGDNAIGLEVEEVDSGASVFLFPSMCISVMQDLAIGSLIRDLNVTDADTGLNGNIIFTLTAPVTNVPEIYLLSEFSQ